MYFTCSNIQSHNVNKLISRETVNACEHIYAGRLIILQRDNETNAGEIYTKKNELFRCRISLGCENMSI